MQHAEQISSARDSFKIASLIFGSKKQVALSVGRITAVAKLSLDREYFLHSSGGTDPYSEWCNVSLTEYEYILRLMRNINHHGLPVKLRD